MVVRSIDIRKTLKIFLKNYKIPLRNYPDKIIRRKIIEENNILYSNNDFNFSRLLGFTLFLFFPVCALKKIQNN